jgi:hypothetical protein
MIYPLEGREVTCDEITITFFEKEFGDFGMIYSLEGREVLCDRITITFFDKEFGDFST